MKALSAFLGVAVLLGGFDNARVLAEQHRATRLGNPATRFAPPVQTAEDLRARLLDLQLRPDIASILRQWGWEGNLDDFFRALATAEIREIEIPVGTTLPFMSSRKDGRPVCLRNVLWAGDAPAPAFVFEFVSNGRQYRCVTPKACSNFLLEDIGLEPKSLLAIDCAAPAEVLVGRPIEVCLTVRQMGNVTEPKTTVSLSLPPNATPKQMSAGGVLGAGRMSWELDGLAPGVAYRRCVVLEGSTPETMSFTATAAGAGGQSAQSSCGTKVVGIPAILIEVVDLEDPVEVGQEVTYEIRVTNQGSAPGTQVRLVATLPPTQRFVAGSGETAVAAEGQTVRVVALPLLAPKATAKWRLVVKAVGAADARLKVELTSDQFESPITEEESTRQY
ncbi:MAG TPA: hypothetical protein PKX23_16495 [Verrucomicrobiota bacterium]|jgi:uncharacterized repeat protein (TIGR01451 family)|nr:hypothetical protein [Verrucomicrobiota bacterium]HRT07240.1 hypothetical protein [Candidatus Paceibacterota bacterium]HRT57787.1 hypothetical protein [Candidatus Paceibacterota bacterium]